MSIEADNKSIRDKQGKNAPGDPLLRLRKQLRLARRQIAEKAEEVSVLKEELERYREGREHVLSPESLVWIFGTARTGSTWLAAMLDEMKRQEVWREPLIGTMFGNLYYNRAGHLAGKPGKHFILGNAYRWSWTNSIKDFVLQEASVRFPRLKDGHLFIKEPNGAMGAPLVMESMPESGLVFLIRDPRDVVASSMDARREGGWQHRERSQGQDSQVDRNPDVFVNTRSKSYVEHISKVREAYEKHPGRKVLIRYEELVADTLPTMQRMYESLGVTYDEPQLVRSVAKHSWDNIPEDKKGEGKFYRKGTSGGWKEDLTPKQVRSVERIASSVLKEYYPGSSDI